MGEKRKMRSFFFSEGELNADRLFLLENRLLQAQRVEAMGFLAPGLAHNINSMLAAISMTAEVAQIKHPEVTELGDILQAASRIGEIVSNLMLKSYLEQDSEATELDLNRLIEIELKFLEANLFFKHEVELKLELQPDLPLLKGRYGDFAFCFFNVVQNALDAMLFSPQRVLGVQTCREDDKARIAWLISDTGCGIPAENLSRIFEPFFTTALERRGTEPVRPDRLGLGLPLTRELLSTYGATIAVSSQRGVGSEFVIRIPCGR